VEYLDCKFHTQKKFAVLFFEHKLNQGISIEIFTVDLFSFTVYNIILDSKGKQMAVAQLLDNLYLQPAPWRKWMQTREEIISDWKAGKDFRIESGPYCSIRDIEYLRSSYNRIYIIHDRGSIEV
jgi:hypothetical protein